MQTRQQPAPAPALARLDGSPVRVLVVDDEPNLTELVSMALRYEGWEVAHRRTAASRPCARAKDFAPDAVVLDMMLPDIDGLEVLRRMRGDEPDVPVLFLTAATPSRTGSPASPPAATTTSPSRSASRRSWPGSAP